MFSKCCSALVVPHPTDQVLRWCPCQRAACWWDDAARGRFAVFSAAGPDGASIIGLHNGLLTEPLAPTGCVGRARMRALIDQTPVPLFRALESLVVNLRPGCNPDCRFVAHRAELPAMSEVGRLQPTS
jgi:hypothetical protein